MDPNKSASAPPQQWGDEKSSMVHAPPPPYQDQPYAGYPQPGPGYPQPGPGGYPPQQQGYSPPPPQFSGAQYGQQPYPGQPAAVTVQPTVYVTQVPLAHPVKDYLAYSIFTMLCCCMPLGIAALIYSIFTREANSHGDQAGAERNSKSARILNHTGLGIGLVIITLYILFRVFVN